MDSYSASFIDRSSLLLKFWFEDSEMDGYDRLEVWRSLTGDGGPYLELTGQYWAGAQVSTVTGSRKVVDKDLELLVGTETLTITFTGTDPLTPAEMATEINDQALGLVVATGDDTSGAFSILTTSVGALARLEVTGGDVAPIIGLELNLASYGTNARITLGSENAYTFEDPWHTEGYYYKTRLTNSSTGSATEFSVPLLGNSTRAVTPDQLIRGHVRLVDIQGRPVGNRTVLLSNKATVHNAVVDDLLVDMGDQEIRTDEDGYASMLLLRGTDLVVSVAGTSLVRDITVPTDSSLDSFNLFDPDVGSDDAFSVQVPDIELAERTTCS